MEGAGVIQPGFFGIFGDELRDAAHEAVFEALLHGGFPPGEVFDDGAAADVLEALGHVRQALGGVGAAVEDDVFYGDEEVFGDVLVHLNHTGVDDAHVHPRADGVVQEGGVHRFAHHIVAPEGKAHVGDSAADLRAGAKLLDAPRRLNEVYAVVVVLLDARRYGEDVGVEDDVLGLELSLLNEEFVGTGANFHLAVFGIGLAGFVEGHHDGGGPVGFDQLCLTQKFFLALLHGNRVDDALALHTLQTGLDHVPLRGVDHDRQLGDVGLGHHEVEEGDHGFLRFEQAFVHIHVDDLRAAFDLMEGNGEGFIVLAAHDETAEFFGAGDVGALPNVDEIGLWANNQRL